MFATDVRVPGCMSLRPVLLGLTARVKGSPIASPACLLAGWLAPSIVPACLQIVQEDIYIQRLTDGVKDVHEGALCGRGFQYLHCSLMPRHVSACSAGTAGVRMSGCAACGPLPRLPGCSARIATSVSPVCTTDSAPARRHPVTRAHHFAPTKQSSFDILGCRDSAPARRHPALQPAHHAPGRRPRLPAHLGRERWGPGDLGLFWRLAAVATAAATSLSVCLALSV